jgi:hypothetical protein
MSPRPRSRPPTAPRRGARLRGLLTVAVVAATSLSGCSLPSVEAPAPATDPAEAPLGSSTPDPARDALVGEVRRLQRTIAAAREGFAAALEGDGLGPARAAADDALELLVAAPGATGSQQGDDDPRPLFPADTLERDDDGDAADQLTVTLTRARDVGGSLGNAVIDLLRDPVAGDLGAWQRDAAGVLASVDRTTDGATTLEEHEVAIAELPGLGTQAVAWAQLTADASSGDAARAFAERGVASLDVIRVTLDRLDLPA